MRLKQTRTKDGRVWLSIVRRYREGGVSKTKTVERVGWLDELKESFDDPVAHFSARAEALTIAEAEAAAARAVEIHPLEKIDARGDLRKNLGFCALSAIYHELGLDGFFKNHQRHRGFEYSVDAVVRLLVFDRVLRPSSKRGAFAAAGDYFESFKFSLDDVYRALTHIAGLKDALLEQLNGRVATTWGRPDKFAYYDVTNYYFEIDEPDDLRRKGVSKEHRPEPIVQMGLLMDASGLPVAYDLFCGNTPDCDTLTTVLSHIRGEKRVASGFGRVVVVADRGVNTSDNVFSLLAKGDGYVFAKSVRGASAELQRWVRSEAGYSPGLDRDGAAFRSKSRIAERTLTVTVAAATDDSPKKTKRTKVTEKQVAFWSAKYAARARSERAEAVARARAMVASPPKLKALIDHTAAKYVLGVTVDENGEAAEVDSVLLFDSERLAREEELDGYYVISTSETQMTAAEIIESYRELWRIEESFRVTKSDLCYRPIYLSDPDHIKAHFAICFIALLICRILQVETGWRHSVATIAETLSRASGTHLSENWWVFDHRDGAIDEIGAALGIDFRRKYLTSGEIRSIVASTKKPRAARTSL